MTKFGVAWYRKDQWDKLLSVSTDRDDLEKTFEEWEDAAERKLSQLKAAGQTMDKIEIDVDELVSWCEKKGLPIDQSARARFAAEKLKREDA
jgi:hypothetical protein